MTRRWPAALLLISAALVAGACSRGEAAQPVEARPVAAAAAPSLDSRARLVFFMNPNGGPCQIQDGVLKGMGAELKDKAELVYYRTTEERDLAQFARYGIRSLPALVLTDAVGRELRRATPGIQSSEQVRQLLGR